MRAPFPLLLAALSVTVAGAPAAGQQLGGLTFSAKTTLLTLDVTALDRDGKPVAGLEAADFEVKLNGAVQPVQALTYLEAEASAPAAAAPAPPALPSGASARRSVVNVAPPENGRMFVIVVDNLSFEPGAGKALFVSAEAFVSALPASDFVGVALTSGSRTINPTQDRRAVLDALKTAVGTFTNPAGFSDAPMVGIGEALEMEEAGIAGKMREVILRECLNERTSSTLASLSLDYLLSMGNPCIQNVPIRAKHIVQQVRANRERQLSALASILESLRRAPGIKHVVLLSNGVPVSTDIGDFEQIARATALAGVEISTMVQEGDIDLSDVGSSVELPGGGSTPVSPGRAQSRRDDDRMLLGGAQTLTDMAGGQFYRVIGQPHRFFDRVVASASAVYRLGVALPAGVTPGQALSITASVKRPGVSALASHYAAAPEPEAALSPEQRMTNAVTHGETLYGVPIAFGAIVRRGPAPGQIEIGAAVGVPGRVEGPLDTVFGLLDPSGALKTGKRQVPAASGGDYDIRFSMPVPPGAYQLRFAVADAHGDVGAVAMPIDASLHAMGGFETSDLLTWARDAAGRMHLLVLEDVPAGVAALTAMIEVYTPAPAPPPGLGVRFALLDAGGRTMDEKNANLAAGGGVLRADAPIEIGALPPGLYVLRAAISAAGRELGTVTTTFRR